LEIFLALAETELLWLFIVGHILAIDKKVFVEVNLLVHYGPHVALKAKDIFLLLKTSPVFFAKDQRYIKGIYIFFFSQSYAEKQNFNLQNFSKF
jgi:hypothetical protein